ncbi:succinate dehydrogenase, hydrophobic membrane anchor protein [Thiohalomonas denitrificans]|uniref:succinate dehydrogenase, hydrophobic membrane anchor protein n=1 Tax=Thiohalomonas denitrificans TaxID=415747 RepID=UPI0026EAB057|nr:succinate dehydrogenase, hydrophobic membrane anchor protein [Thiohalomonas denitrificans]
MSRPLTGLSAWLVQRLSAIYMALFTIAAVVLFTVTPIDDYGDWQALWGRPVVSAATALFFVALLLHSWVGIRDVILDYVGWSTGLRLTLLALVGAWLLILGFWILEILLTVVSPWN